MKPLASIELFLRYLKQFVEEGSFILVNRDASLAFMEGRGMSMEMLTNVVLSLRPSDCFDGPEQDRDPRFADNWTVAEFSPVYCGERLYLKLSIRMDVRRSKCLSVKAYVERSSEDE